MKTLRRFVLQIPIGIEFVMSLSECLSFFKSLMVLEFYFYLFKSSSISSTSPIVRIVFKLTWIRYPVSREVNAQKASKQQALYTYKEAMNKFRNKYVMEYSAIA